MPKCYRQLQVKDLPKVPTWQLEWDSNLRLYGRKAPYLPLRRYVPHTLPAKCGSDRLTSDEYSLKFFEVCVCLKFLLCNILPGLICIWNAVYEVGAKHIFERNIYVRFKCS